jgi:hypothetical protein
MLWLKRRRKTRRPIHDFYHHNHHAYLLLIYLEKPVARGKIKVAFLFIDSNI